jgi:glycosyltransferase involved in cell wall biosynthesis
MTATHQARTSLHVFLTPAEHETRFLREAYALLDAKLCEKVVLVAKWEPGLTTRVDVADGIEIQRPQLSTHQLPRRLPWQLIKGAEWSRHVLRIARECQPRVIVAHSLAALWPSLNAARSVRARLIYDAHELETERNGLVGVRKWIERAMEKRWIHRCDGVICVSDEIAEWYHARYGITRPTVIRNLPLQSIGSHYVDKRILRSKCGIAESDIVFLYQGALFRGRRLEQFLRIFTSVPANRHLVVMGYGPLEAMVRAAAAVTTNIHFVPAVAPAEVLAYTAGADVGLVGVEAVCKSYYLSLPNKLFEYLAAGLSVIAPKYPEISRVVESLNAGILVGDDDKMWRTAILQWRRASPKQPTEENRHWRGMYTWEQEAKRFTAFYRNIDDIGTQHG